MWTRLEKIQSPTVESNADTTRIAGNPEQTLAWHNWLLAQINALGVDLVSFPALTNRIKRWLAPPIFADDNIKTRRARVLNVVLLTVMAGVTLFVVAGLLGGRSPASVLSMDGVLFVTCLVSRHWMHHGRVKLASISVIVMGTIGVTATVATLGTIRTPSTAVYLVIVLIAGLLFDLDGILATAALNSLAVLGLSGAENAGLLPHPDFSVTITQWGTYAVLFGLTGVMTFTSLRTTRHALARADRELAERTRVEAQLRESEERFRRLAEAGLEGIVISDQGKIIDANMYLADMLGCRVPELIGVPWTDIVAPKSLDFATQHIRPADEETYECLASRRDGSVFWVETQTKAIPYQGRTLHVTAIRDIAERRRAEGRVQLQMRRLGALHAIDTAVTSPQNLRETLNVILEQVTTHLGVDAADVLVFDSHTQVLEYAAGTGFRSKALQHTRLRLGEGYAGAVVAERAIVSIPDLAAEPDAFARSPLLASEDFRIYIGAPLVIQEQVKGVLEIFNRTPFSPSQEWFNFLKMLATQTAVAIDNKTLFNNLQCSNEELARAYDTTLEGWSRALELRDRETKGHTLRTTALTVQLARALGVAEAELQHVRRGALLHDIGKLGIPDSILGKPGPLSEDEWVVMRKHPVYAYDLLSPIPYLKPALDIPYCHHEKWDGSGYPRGLHGEQIPLAARVFAVVDVWDALCSDRPYRSAWPAEKARAYIRSSAGTHFEPGIVALFLKVTENESVRAG